MRRIVPCVLLAASTFPALCQEFEVVSVKPSKAENFNSGTTTSRISYTASNVSLKSLIATAHKVKDYQVKGPDWLDSARFDIIAKLPEDLPKNSELRHAAMREMVRKMLADRFHLEVHNEQKLSSVFGMIVAKNGVRFKEVPDTDSHNQNSNNTHYNGECVSMDLFAEFLSGQSDQPVINMTDLKGFYDLKLDWAPEPKASAGGKGPVPVAPEPLSGPTLAAALQDQLGLKLEPRKAPIQMLVVDRVEKVPTEN